MNVIGLSSGKQASQARGGRALLESFDDDDGAHIVSNESRNSLGMEE